MIFFYAFPVSLGLTIVYSYGRPATPLCQIYKILMWLITHSLNKSNYLESHLFVLFFSLYVIIFIQYYSVLVQTCAVMYKLTKIFIVIDCAVVLLNH